MGGNEATTSTRLRDGAQIWPTLHSWAELTKQSLTLLVDVERRAHQAAAAYDDEPWRLDNFTMSLPGKTDLSLFATSDGIPIGFLVASHRDNGVHVHRLAVDPSYWGLGIASILLARLLAGATGPVTITCDWRNHPAIALYHRAGFRASGTTSDGKLVMSTPPLPPRADLRIWYVYTTINMMSGHAAHVPGLVDAMSRISQTTGIGYGDGADLPRFRPSVRWIVSLARLLARARRERVDVVFVRIHWKLAVLFWLAGRLGGGWKSVLWSSGGAGHCLDERPRLWSRFGRRIHRFAVRRGVDAVVTGPPTMADKYAMRFGLDRERLLVAANDVNILGWSAAAARDPVLAEHPDVRRWLAATHRILFVHSLTRIHGADRIPQILAGLRHRLGDVEMLVLGDGPLADRLVEQPLTVCGSVSNDVVAWAMARSHCVVMPSRSGREGFPRVIIEAMALGVPCVVFDVGGCADIFGTLGADYVAPPDDVPSMITLAGRAAHRCAVDGPLPELIERAYVFDTQPVATALVLTLRSLHAQGNAAASWMSRSVWQQVFSARRTR